MLTTRFKPLRDWFRDGSNRLFLLLLLLLLAPVWLFRYFPSQDGPNHLYTSWTLLHYHDPGAALFRKFYTLNPSLNPNWLCFATLAGLMAVVPPLVAEKILITLYLLLLAVGARQALRAVRPGAEPLAVLVFPFAYNWMLHMGFYNYCLSLAVMFFTVGYWIRHQDRPRPRHGACLALLFLLLYLCHVISATMAGVAVGTLTLWLTLYDWLAGRARAGWNAAEWRRQAWARLGFTLPALGMPTILMLFFMRREAAAGNTASPFAVSFYLRKAVSLLTLDTALFTFRFNEIYFGFALSAGLLLLAAAAGWRVFRRLERWDGLALVTLAWAAAFLVAPDAGGGGMYLNIRMAVYVHFGLILWLAVRPLARPLLLAAQTLGAGFALIFILFYAQRYGELQSFLAEYTSAAAAVRPGSVLLPVCLSPNGALPGGEDMVFRMAPFIHASSLVALERGCIDLSDYQGAMDYFPTRYRPALNPYHSMKINDAADPAMNWFDPERFERASGVRIDAVLVWDDPGHRLDSPQLAPLRARLERLYRLVYTSQPRGLMKVYQRRS